MYESSRHRLGCDSYRLLRLWSDLCYVLLKLQDKPVPVVEIVRPEGAGFVCGVIKPGHTLIMVNDRSLLSLSMRDSAKIIAEAAEKVKSSAGRVPCVFRFLKTEMVPDGASPTAIGRYEMV